MASRTAVFFTWAIAPPRFLHNTDTRSVLTSECDSLLIASRHRTGIRWGMAVTQSAIRPQELNPAKLATLYCKQFELCNLKRGETVVAISDLGTRREYVAAA